MRVGKELVRVMCFRAGVVLLAIVGGWLQTAWAEEAGKRKLQEPFWAEELRQAREVAATSRGGGERQAARPTWPELLTPWCMLLLVILTGWYAYSTHRMAKEAKDGRKLTERAILEARLSQLQASHALLSADLVRMKYAESVRDADAVPHLEDCVSAINTEIQELSEEIAQLKDEDPAI